MPNPPRLVLNANLPSAQQPAVSVAPMPLASGVRPPFQFPFQNMQSLGAINANNNIMAGDQPYGVGNYNLLNFPLRLVGAAFGGPGEVTGGEVSPTGDYVKAKATNPIKDIIFNQGQNRAAANSRNFAHQRAAEQAFLDEQRKKADQERLNASINQARAIDLEDAKSNRATQLEDVKTARSMQLEDTKSTRAMQLEDRAYQDEIRRQDEATKAGEAQLQFQREQMKAREASIIKILEAHGITPTPDNIALYNQQIFGSLNKASHAVDVGLNASLTKPAVANAQALTSIVPAGSLQYGVDLEGNPVRKSGMIPEMISEKGFDEVRGAYDNSRTGMIIPIDDSIMNSANQKFSAPPQGSNGLAARNAAAQSLVPPQVSVAPSPVPTRAPAQMVNPSHQSTQLRPWDTGVPNVMTKEDMQKANAGIPGFGAGLMRSLGVAGALLNPKSLAEAAKEEEQQSLRFAPLPMPGY